MNLWLIWVLGLIISSVLIGAIKWLLDIEISSKYKYGKIIYEIIDSGISVVLGYLLLSALSGHFLQ